MSDIITAVIVYLGGTGLVAYLLRNWIVERLRQSIKHEYDQKIERLRAQLLSENATIIEKYKSELSREASVLAIAHKSLSESVSIAQRQRVDGVSVLWKALISVRNHSPGIFGLLDVLQPDEYSRLYGHDFKAFNPEISPEDIKLMCGGELGTIESIRPFVGEYLWFLFYVYQAVHLRIAVRFAGEWTKGQFSPWYQDSPTLQFLETFFTGEEMSQFRELKFGQIVFMRELLESKFLAAAERVISGQTAANFTAEEAARISKAVSEAERYTRGL
jgi:hypothetical protein